MKNEENIDGENIKCPDIVPEDQKGMTEEELEWSVKNPPRPKVPRYVFIALALILLVAFGGGSWWYYRKNVLPEKYYLRATTLMKDKQYARAEELYRRIMKIRPERRDVLYNIAYCKEETGETAEAIKYYEEHLKTAKNDTKAMTRLGWLYMKGGDYEQALKWLKEAASRDKKNDELWRLTAKAAMKAGDVEEAGKAWLHIATLCKEPDKIMACGKELLALKDYRRALDVYALAAKAAPDDKRPLHGMSAARAMLGLPTEAKFVIKPGESLGLIKLDASKEEVKEEMGGRAPDAKIFGLVGGKSMMADHPVEIWLYNEGDPQRELRVIFISGKVNEIETASPLYKTEEGLGLSNFLLAKNADKIKWRKEARNSALVCLAKGGGLTFFASGLNEAGTEAKYKRLRVHHGEVSIDNVDGFSLMNLGSR